MPPKVNRQGSFGPPSIVVNKPTGSPSNASVCSERSVTSSRSDGSFRSASSAGSSHSATGTSHTKNTTSPFSRSRPAPRASPSSLQPTTPTRRDRPISPNVSPGSASGAESRTPPRSRGPPTVPYTSRTQTPPPPVRRAASRPITPPPQCGSSSAVVDSEGGDQRGTRPHRPLRSRTPPPRSHTPPPRERPRTPASAGPARPLRRRHSLSGITGDADGVVLPDLPNSDELANASDASLPKFGRRHSVSNLNDALPTLTRRGSASASHTHDAASNSNSNIQIALRVRPFSEHELEADDDSIVLCHDNKTVLYSPEYDSHKVFTFDFSFISTDPAAPNFAAQTTLYDTLGQKMVDNAWAGFNSSLIAYGQTGAGKSYTMVGTATDDTHAGIFPRVCAGIFDKVSALESDCVDDGATRPVVTVTVSMLEILNEHIYDLLTAQPSAPAGLKLKQNALRGFFVDGLQHYKVTDKAAMLELMEIGINSRTIRSTMMNACSSRSHTIFTIDLHVEQKVDNGVTHRKSITRIVDLAGSERAKKSGSSGEALREGVNINLSLLHLGLCISLLASGDRSVLVPFRQSKLTSLLKESLAGNSKTAVIACVSPSRQQYHETLSTLQFATRAKYIKNDVKVNISNSRSLVQELEVENQKLRAELDAIVRGGYVLQTQLKTGFDACRENLVAEFEKLASAALSRRTSLESHGTSDHKSAASEPRRGVDVTQLAKHFCSMASSENSLDFSRFGHALSVLVFNIDEPKPTFETWPEFEEWLNETTTLADPMLLSKMQPPPQDSMTAEPKPSLSAKLKEAATTLTPQGERRDPSSEAVLSFSKHSDLIKALFHCLDSDGDGSLTQEEVNAFLDEYQQSHTDNGQGGKKISTVVSMLGSLLESISAREKAERVSSLKVDVPSERAPVSWEQIVSWAAAEAPRLRRPVSGPSVDEEDGGTQRNDDDDDDDDDGGIDWRSDTVSAITLGDADVASMSSQGSSLDQNSGRGDEARARLLSQRLSDTTRDLHATKVSLATCERELEQLKADYAHAQRKISQFTTEANNSHAGDSELSQLKAQKQADFAAYSEGLRALNSELQQVKQQSVFHIDALTDKLAALQKQLDEKDKVIFELHETATHSSHDADTVLDRDLYREKCASLTAKVKLLSQQQEAQCEELNTQRQLCDKLTKEVTAVRERSKQELQLGIDEARLEERSRLTDMARSLAQKEIKEAQAQTEKETQAYIAQLTQAREREMREYQQQLNEAFAAKLDLATRLARLEVAQDKDNEILELKQSMANELQEHRVISQQSQKLFTDLSSKDDALRLVCEQKDSQIRRLERQLQVEQQRHNRSESAVREWQPPTTTHHQPMPWERSSSGDFSSQFAAVRNHHAQQIAMCEQQLNVVQDRLSSLSSRRGSLGPSPLAPSALSSDRMWASKVAAFEAQFNEFKSSS